MRLRHLAAAATLLAAPAFAADPFALLPTLTGQLDAVQCDKVGEVQNQLISLKTQREEALADERDALQPRVEAEMQSWTAQLMQGGDYAAMSQQIMEYQQTVSAGAAGQLETDPDCIALTSKNQSTGLSQALAPEVKPARVALVKSLEGKTGEAYVNAYPGQVAGYAASLNSIVRKVAQKGAQCATARQQRSVVKNSTLSPSMKKMIELGADAELQKLVIATQLSSDQMSLCLTLDSLKDYATADELLTAAWYEKPLSLGIAAGGRRLRGSVAYSNRNPVDSALQQVKDNAVGKAVDKAFGSLFGR